jgi:hypothetical protein
VVVSLLTPLAVLAVLALIGVGILTLIFLPLWL